jgi:hypothetical protein
MIEDSLPLWADRMMALVGYDAIEVCRVELLDALRVPPAKCRNRRYHKRVHRRGVAVRHLDSAHQAGVPSRELVGPLVGQFFSVDENHDALAKAVMLSQRGEEYSLA